ncbi:MAG: hypothetical protein HC772_16240 [Leptolyngbyaceae cyanobacterium CRU_2_3]|nr:hypothetical protein [Leptolyngbyaceae cyanobacterium CRU_2_3]
MRSPQETQPTSHQPATETPVARRSIFREDAVHRYIAGQEKTVLPQLVSPRTFTYLWVLLGVLGASSAIAWFARIPIYATGAAVVVRWRDQPTDAQRIVVAAFLPPQSLARLQQAETAMLHLDGLDKSSQNEGRRPILVVQPEVLSPETIQQQFALNPSVAQQVNRPAAIVIMPLEPIASGLPASAYLGSVGRVEAEVGTRKLISFLPLIEQRFAD